MGVLDEVKQEQQKRSQALLHPFTGIKNHAFPVRPNIKNKYVRLNEMRQRFKMDKLGAKRERNEERQLTRDVARTLQQQAEALEVDLEQLLEEEREEEANEPEAKDLERYQSELEEYFNEMKLTD